MAEQFTVPLLAGGFVDMNLVRMNMVRWLVGSMLAGAALAVVPLITSQSNGQEVESSTPETSDVQAVRRHAEGFVEAFNRADAKAVAALWAEDGEMSVDGQSHAKGRTEIEQAYADFFTDNPGVEISVHVDSIRRLGPKTIIEKGVSEIMNDDADDLVDTYTIVHVLQDEQWRIVSADVRQEVVDAVDWKMQLATLEGKWTASEGDWRVETEYEWVAGGNYLKRTFQVLVENKIERSGVEVIGWDPLERRVTSWLFGSTGGHGRGWWELDGNQWEIASEGVTAEGEVVAATNVITIVNDDLFRWQSTDRSISGYALDDTFPLRVTRAADAQ